MNARAIEILVKQQCTVSQMGNDVLERSLSSQQLWEAPENFTQNFPTQGIKAPQANHSNKENQHHMLSVKLIKFLDVTQMRQQLKNGSQ